jgi:hypothetical protein
MANAVLFLRTGKRSLTRSAFLPGWIYDSRCGQGNELGKRQIQSAIRRCVNGRAGQAND